MGGGWDRVAAKGAHESGSKTLCRFGGGAAASRRAEGAGKNA